jgi:hypothetical protein
MQPNVPERDDDLNNVEERLANWLPAADGLNAEAMLFAAGLAAGRRGRIIWPTLCVVLLAPAVGFGVWGFTERAERRALAQRLDERSAAPVRSPQAPAVESPGPEYVPSPNDYLQLRQRAELDPDGWLAMSRPGGQREIGALGGGADHPKTMGSVQPVAGPPPPEPAVFSAFQRDWFVMGLD